MKTRFQVTATRADRSTPPVSFANGTAAVMLAAGLVGILDAPGAYRRADVVVTFGQVRRPRIAGPRPDTVTLHGPDWAVTVARLTSPGGARHDR